MSEHETGLAPELNSNDVPVEHNAHDQVDPEVSKEITRVRYRTIY